MDNFQLIIDYRENKLIEQFNNRQIQHKTENLDIGDIMITSGETALPMLIIERKTIADLRSSICDGRLREQRYRLLQASGLPPSRIMYIIEGSFETTNKRLLKTTHKQVDNSTLLSSIINMQFRDNIKVQRTNSIEETSDFVIKLFSKIGDKDIFQIQKQTEHSEMKSEPQNEPPSYTSTIHKKKKENMNPETWFVCQLSMIPQISDTIATVITKTYPTLLSLILKYQSIAEDERPDLLSNLTYDLSTGKKRKIGKVVSNRVYEFLYRQG
jgi:crossover junction endonuclease MUS81